MNNVFIEGPVQTGKSTLIRKTLRDMFGPGLEGVAGFTSQRITEPDGRLLGFRLAEAGAPLTITGDPAALDHVFKWFESDGPHVDMNVFETAGIDYMRDAFDAVRTRRARLILLDEIGGHELMSDSFRTMLYELLDSPHPCAGVIKSPENTRRMDPALLELNQQLHTHLTVVSNFAEAVSDLEVI